MKMELAKWIGLGITILTLVVGAAVWASSEHTAIESRSRANFISKEYSKSVYAPKEDVVRIDQRTKGIEEDIDDIKRNLDNVDSKLDRVINYMIQGKRDDNTPR